MKVIFLILRTINTVKDDLLNEENIMFLFKYEKVGFLHYHISEMPRLVFPEFNRGFIRVLRYLL